MRRLFLIAIISVLVAPVFGQTGRIYVYSSWDSSQHGWLAVFFDEKRIANIERGKFFAMDVTPGKHVLWAGHGVPEAIEVKAGEEVFVRVEQYVEVGVSGKTSMPALAVNSPTSAKAEIASLVYIDAKHMYSALVLRDDSSVKWEPGLKKRDKEQ